MIRYALLLFVLLLPFGECLAQHREHLSVRVEEDIFGSVKDVTEWYDAPVILLFLARNSYKSDNPSTKIIALPPLPFEREFAAGFTPGGMASPGSMDSWLLPNAIFGARLLYSLGHTLAGEEDMREEYAHAFTFYKVLMYNHIATELIKNTVRRSRPDDSDTKSFFSGHTSTAFVASAFLYRETADVIDNWDVAAASPALRFGLKSASFAVLYGWAGYVGYSRIADSKHYLTDVLVGAAVGTLIGNLVYGQYFSASGSDALPTVGIGIIDTEPAISLSVTF